MNEFTAYAAGGRVIIVPTASVRALRLNEDKLMILVEYQDRFGDIATVSAYRSVVILAIISQITISREVLAIRLPA